MRRPDGGAFFDQNGLLFLSLDELNALSDQLVTAQPLIGSLSADPSLRGLFDTLKLFVTGATRGDVGIDKLDPTLDKIAGAVDGVAAGRPGEPVVAAGAHRRQAGPAPAAQRLVPQPVLDYSALGAGPQGDRRNPPYRRRSRARREKWRPGAHHRLGGAR